MRPFVFLGLLLCGCSYSKPILSLPHADGSGVTHYRAVHVGGVLRPGVVVIVQETVGSNGPVVLTTAHGTPLAPAVFGVAGNIGTAFALGAAWPESQNNSSTTTVIRDEPLSPPIPPQPQPSRPPWGPPPGRPRGSPHNGGR